MDIFCFPIDVVTMSVHILLIKKVLAIKFFHLDRWILNIRRAVLTGQNRSPVPGSITLLAPHYKEGMERMYASLRRVVGYVQPD